MMLITKRIRKHLPKLGATEDDGLSLAEKIVHFKVFNPNGSGTWYVLEGEDEGDDMRLYAWVEGLGEDEIGYVMLSDLENTKGRFGLHMERDLHFSPKPLGEITGVVLPSWARRAV